jgi:DNA polymerase-3 subunit delta'
MAFESLLGQPYVSRLLKSALAGKRVASAFLFFGPPACGKKTAALALAKALFCPQGGCGQCNTCKRIEHRSHPDVLVFKPAGQVFKVDQARALLHEASLRPFEASGRLFILDQAETLNDSSGNALLKLLEEPQPGQHLVLVTTQPAKVLSTIASRCQPVRFSPLPEVVAVRLLMQARNATEAKALEASRLAGGDFSAALELLKPDGQTKMDLALGLLEAAASPSKIKKLAWAQEACLDKEELPSVLALAGVMARELLVRALNLPASTHLMPQAPEHGRGLSPEHLEALLAAIAKAQEALRHHVTAPLATEILALT